MSTPSVSTELATYKVDPAHSQAGFTVRHMGFSKVRGHFDAFDATIEMEGDDLESLNVVATIQAASISTSDDKRDAHLKSADFFEVETYPEISFKSTGVSNIDRDRFELNGKLTMHGVSKEISLDAVYLGQGEDPWGGTRVAFEASKAINRKDFGLNWNAVLEAGALLVSEIVEIRLEVQAVKQ